MQNMLNSALFSVIESLTELTPDTVANLETVLDSPSIGFNVQLQIIGKFLSMKIRPVSELLKRLDRCNLEEIINPEYLLTFSHFLAQL